MTLRFFHNDYFQSGDTIEQYFYDYGPQSIATDAPYFYNLAVTETRGLSVSGTYNASLTTAYAAVRRDFDYPGPYGCNSFVYAPGFVPDPSALYDDESFTSVPGSDVVSFSGIAALPLDGDKLVIASGNKLLFCEPGQPTVSVTLNFMLNGGRRALAVDQAGQITVLTDQGGEIYISEPITRESTGTIPVQASATHVDDEAWVKALLSAARWHLGAAMVKAACQPPTDTYETDFVVSSEGRVGFLAEPTESGIQVYGPGDWIYVVGAQSVGSIKPEIFLSTVTWAPGAPLVESSRALQFTGVIGQRIRGLGIDRAFVPASNEAFWGDFVRTVEVV